MSFMKHTQSYKRALQETMSFSQFTRVSKLELERSNRDVLDYTKRNMADKFAHAIIEANKFHFEKETDSESQQRATMFAIHGEENYAELYRSEMYAFTREELQDLLEKFGDNLMQEFPMMR